jgi:hypothetical protein
VVGKFLVSGKLSARKVATAGPGIYPDDDGLYLCVTKSLARAWVYRYSWQGRRPEMGLGSVADGIGLAEARAARDEARRIRRTGRNPIEAKREASKAAARRRTFGEIADALLETRASEWRRRHIIEKSKVARIDGCIALGRSDAERIIWLNSRFAYKSQPGRFCNRMGVSAARV